MKKKIFVLALLPLLLASCGGGKQSTQRSQNTRVITGSSERVSSQKPGESLPYEIDKTGSINRFYANEKNSKVVYIPATYSISNDGKIVSGSTYQVKTISAYCFANNNLLETVFIPDTVTLIENNAFDNCPNLQMIVVPSSVAAIGENAFDNCPKLQNIASDNHENTIVLKQNSNLRTFPIPNSVTALASGAFSGWDKLYELELGVNITRVGSRCLSNCPELYRVTINGVIDEYSLDVMTNCPKIKYLTFKKSVQNIRSIAIPESITELADQQFHDWEFLEEVCFGPNTQMKQGIFRNNKKLKRIVCPETNVLRLFYYGYRASDIEDSYFYSSMLSSYSETRYFQIPKTLKEVQLLNGTSVVQSCFLGMSSVESITLPSTITSFSNGCFYGLTNIKTVYFQTDYNWGYRTSTSGGSQGTVNKGTMNTPSALATKIKEYFINASSYMWASVDE